ncbi:hypothetical protein VTN00DRAFT_5133 [Thermoascus crustaceus]|uniref:uncharacterized protein n=1 Tax=Thermoascus crustaceus TaxID=5088 RepID=UPI003742E2D6
MSKPRSSRRSSAKDSTEHAVELLNGVNQATDVSNSRHSQDDTNTFHSAVDYQNGHVELPPRVTKWRRLVSQSSPVSPRRSGQRAQLRHPSRRSVTRTIREPRSDGMFIIPDTPSVRRSARLSLQNPVSPLRRSSRLSQLISKDKIPPTNTLGHTYDHGDGGDGTHERGVVAMDMEEDESEESATSEDVGSRAERASDDLPDIDTLLQKGRNAERNENSDSTYEENEMEDAEYSESSDSDVDNSKARRRTSNPSTPVKTSAAITNGRGSRSRPSGDYTGPTTRRHSRVGDTSEPSTPYELRPRSAEKRQSVLDRVEIPEPSPRRRGRPRRHTRNLLEKVANVARGQADVESSGLQENVQDIDAEQPNTEGPRTPEDSYVNDGDANDIKRQRDEEEEVAREEEERERERQLFVDASELFGQKDNWDNLVKKANALRGFVVSRQSKGRIQDIKRFIQELCETYRKEIRTKHSEGHGIPDRLLRDCEHLVEAISVLAFKMFEKAYKLEVDDRNGAKAAGLVDRLEVQVIPCIVDAAKECLKAHYVEGILALEGFDQLEAVLNMLLSLCERSFNLKQEGYIPSAGRSRQLRLPLRRILQALREEGFKRKMYGDDYGRPDTMDLDDSDDDSEPEREWTEEEGVALLDGLWMFKDQPNRYTKIVRHFWPQLRGRTPTELQAKARQVRDSYVLHIEDELQTEKGRQEWEWLMSA